MRQIEKDIYIDLSARQRALYKALLANVSVADLLAKAANIGDADSARSLMNLVMQFRKVCNHPELFERADVVTPFSFSRFGRPGPLAREGDYVLLPYSTKNPIGYTIPELFYRDGGLLDIPGEDLTTPSHSGSVKKHLNIWSADWMHKSLLEDGEDIAFEEQSVAHCFKAASSFSFLRVLGLSPSEAHSLHVAPLIRRRLHFVGSEAELFDDDPYNT